MIETKTTRTHGPWYAKQSAGGHQGLVISETTGATVAVAYDPCDTDMLAAAPDLLAALEMICAKAEETDGRFARDVAAVCRAAIAKAEGR